MRFFVCWGNWFTGRSPFDKFMYVGDALGNSLQRNGCRLAICIMCWYSYLTRCAEKYKIFTLWPLQLFSLTLRNFQECQIVLRMLPQTLNVFCKVSIGSLWGRGLWGFSSLREYFMGSSPPLKPRMLFMPPKVHSKRIKIVDENCSAPLPDLHKKINFYTVNHIHSSINYTEGRDRSLTCLIPLF